MIQPHTVTIVTPMAGTDRRGDTTLDYGVAATRINVSGWMQQGSVSELLGDRDVTKGVWTLFSNATPDLVSSQQIEWNSAVYQITGDPNHLWNDRAYSHTQAELTLVEG